LVSDLLALPKRSDTTPLLTRILPDAHPKRVERGAAAGKAQQYWILQIDPVVNIMVFSTRSAKILPNREKILPTPSNLPSEIVAKIW
jgi:hypothetical protein